MNVVFDLGGVVFNWQPLAIIRSVFSDAKTQDLVKARIFEHADWIALDRGTLALDQAIARGASWNNTTISGICSMESSSPVEFRK